MTSELPAVDAKVSKSASESVVYNSVVTESSNMPLTPKSAKYEALKSLSDVRTTRDLTEDGVRDILRRFSRDHGLELVSMGSLEDMSGLNDAFNSCICSMDVRVRRSDSANEENFHFVIKSPPKSSFIKMMHKFSRPFFNEVTWYEDLVPILELANGKGCIDRMLPKCYFAYSNYYMQEAGNQLSCCERRTCPWFCYVPCKPSEVGILILENIKHRVDANYRMFDKSKPMDVDHVRLVMKELANFHGMWLKYKFMAKSGNLDSQPRRGSDGLHEVTPLSWETFERRHNTQKRMPKLVYSQLKKVAKRTVLRILAQCGASETANADKCRHFFNYTATRWLNEYMREEPQPQYTLCHGDFWSNNILFSYDADDSATPNSLVIIDYQLINVGSPCYDLVYFLYLNTDLAFRDEHLMTCLRVYYDQFSTYFEDHLKYSYEEFLEDFQRFKAIGFTTACSVMPNILSDTKVDLQGNPITAFAELQRKQVRFEVHPFY